MSHGGGQRPCDAWVVKYVKYPRTYHLPWSPGTTDDDRVLEDVAHFVGHQVVVTPKLDGENATLYDDYCHARSLQGRPHPSQDWLRNLHARIKHEIPHTWRICGENLAARHVIGYSALPSYFIVFSIWDGTTSLSWDETEQFAELLGLEAMPVLYRGVWDEVAVRACLDRAAVYGADAAEGYVVRLAGSFAYADFPTSVAKYVRAGHADNGAQHWHRSSWRRNVLAAARRRRGSESVR